MLINKNNEFSSIIQILTLKINLLILDLHKLDSIKLMISLWEVHFKNKSNKTKANSNSSKFSIMNNSFSFFIFLGSFFF